MSQVNPQHTRYPDVEFDATGRLTADSEAKACIKSLPEGELVNELEALEAAYNDFRKSWKVRFAEFFAGLPLTLFRKQFAAVARAYQAELARKDAVAIQGDTQSEFYRLREEQRKLREFVALNFEPQLNKAVAQNKPLMELVKELLVR